jgi:hypothetical protein
LERQFAACFLLFAMLTISMNQERKKCADVRGGHFEQGVVYTGTRAKSPERI